MDFKNNPIISMGFQCPLNLEDIALKKQLFDFCPVEFCKAMPQLKSIVTEMLSILPYGKFHTVKYTEQIYTPSDFKTCKDTSFHIDGEDNHYALICWGSDRTIFLDEESKLPSVPDKLSEAFDINQKLKSLDLSGYSQFEIPDGEVVLYDSSCIHKGREATPGNRRIFLRVCTSDYLQPKNFIPSPNQRKRM